MKCPRCRTDGLSKGSMWFPDEVDFDLAKPVCHRCMTKIRNRRHNQASRRRGAERANRDRSGDSEDDDE